MDLKYYRIDVETTSQGIEIITAKLMSHGIDASAVIDAGDIEEIMKEKTAYGWDYIEDSVIEKMKESPKITVYTDKYSEVEDVMRALNELSTEIGDGIFGEGADIGKLRPEIAIGDDSEWKDKWKEYFKAFRVSEHIVVKPTWERYDNTGTGDIVIEIDPGMAFGTGAHETTSMCIQMLEKHMDEGDTVLDAGCGSGILTIAAAKLGAGKVLGIDIDETAVSVARENIRRNDVGDTARAELGDVGENIDFLGNMVVANLTTELIRNMSGVVQKYLEKGGVYIVSGILTEKKSAVLQALNEVELEIAEVCEKGEWCCIVSKKKTAFDEKEEL